MVRVVTMVVITANSLAVVGAVAVAVVFIGRWLEV